MNQIRVPVVSVSGQPLSPTTPSKARKMLKSGVATPHRDKLGNFYIQMTREVGSIIPHETVVGIEGGERLMQLSDLLPHNHPLRQMAIPPPQDILPLYIQHEPQQVGIAWAEMADGRMRIVAKLDKGRKDEIECGTGLAVERNERH